MNQRTADWKWNNPNGILLDLLVEISEFRPQKTIIQKVLPLAFTNNSKPHGPFQLKSASLQYFSGSSIRFKSGSINSEKAQFFEPEPNHGNGGLGHIALVPEIFTEPKSQFCTGVFRENIA